jgi:hypothetical protein
MEALQATKVLAHYEQTVEKHALPNTSTTTRPIAQEEGVQNRQREEYPGMGGKIPENTPSLSLPHKVSMKSGVFSSDFKRSDRPILYFTRRMVDLFCE